MYIYSGCSNFFHLLNIICFYLHLVVGMISDSTFANIWTPTNEAVVVVFMRFYAIFELQACLAKQQSFYFKSNSENESSSFQVVRVFIFETFYKIFSSSVDIPQITLQFFWYFHSWQKGSVWYWPSVYFSKFLRLLLIF